MKGFQSMLKTEKKGKSHEDNVSESAKLQAFIKEECLTGVYNDIFPSTAEQMFNLLYSDGSSFTNEYRLSKKDTNLVVGEWHGTDDYDGEVREVTYRSICRSPMCPPDTAVTEIQHAVFSPDKKLLVFETITQNHDVPFGSYFEIHCRWRVQTTSETSSTLDVKVGAHFKKWCLMQSRIKSSTLNYKKELEVVLLPLARAYIKS